MGIISALADKKSDQWGKCLLYLYWGQSLFIIRIFINTGSNCAIALIHIVIEASYSEANCSICNNIFFFRKQINIYIYVCPCAYFIRGRVQQILFYYFFSEHFTLKYLWTLAPNKNNTEYPIKTSTPPPIYICENNRKSNKIDW